MLRVSHSGPATEAEGGDFLGWERIEQDWESVGVIQERAARREGRARGGGFMDLVVGTGPAQQQSPIEKRTPVSLNPPAPPTPMGTPQQGLKDVSQALAFQGLGLFLPAPPPEEVK